MIANTVTGTKIFMGIVIKSAPADGPGNRIIETGGIQNLQIAERLFYLPFFLVESFGWVHVTHKFRYQVRNFMSQSCDFFLPAQRSLFSVIDKVVKGIDILQEIAPGGVPHTPGLTGGIQFPGDSVGLGVKFIVVFRFVDPDSPEDN